MLKTHSGEAATRQTRVTTHDMPRQRFDLNGRVALVTGAAQGMGRAMALALAEAGADLLIADINAAANDSTAGAIRELGRRALPLTCDVTDIDQIRAMFAALDREYGRIDILGNVAGPGQLGSPETINMEVMADVVSWV